MASPNDAPDFSQIDIIDFLNRKYSDLSTKIYPIRVPLLDPLIVGYNYIFMTCPRLSIVPEAFPISQDPFLQNLRHEQYNNTARQLGLPLYEPDPGEEPNSLIYDNATIQILAGGSGISPFIPLVTNNAVKFSAMDSKLDTIDYSETWNKNKIVLGTSSQDSRMAGTIMLEFMEDNDLHCLKLNHLWEKYIEKAFLGDIVTAESLVSAGIGTSGVFNKGAIDYAVALFHFVVGPDGETLTYWAKYTGVLPITVPWSIFSSDDASQSVIGSVPIEFQYTYKEEMNMYILRDFNKITDNKATLFDPVADAKYYEGSYANIGNPTNYPNVVRRPPKDNSRNLNERENCYILQFDPANQVA
jgi:hypothetical protein